MKSCALIIIFFLYSSSVFSQFVTKKLLFSDNFQNNKNAWESWSLEDEGYESYIRQSQNDLYCYLPESNINDWNWTWIPFPDSIVTLMNSKFDVELDFDWSILDSTSKAFEFALMFDLYHVRRRCPGGNFRAIWIDGDQQNINASFINFLNCKRRSDYIAESKGIVKLKPINSFRLVRESYSWKVFINDTQTLEFQYKGKLNLDHLNFGKGKYSFKNFKIYKSELNINSREAHDTANIPLIDTVNASHNSEIPKIWVLLAGIKNYKSKALDSLKYTVNDVNKMYEFWTSINGGGIPPNQIKLLADESVTAVNICSSATNMVLQAGPNDVIVVFLAGHGGIGKFFTFDGELQYKFLNNIISSSKAQNKFMFIDACHSGSINPTVYAPRGKTLSPNDARRLYYQALANSGTNIGYLLACRYDELSVESSDFEDHGLFTYCLLKGLKGDADIDGDHLISIHEIEDYLKVMVPSKNKLQNPELKGYYNRDVPISVYLN